MKSLRRDLIERRMWPLVALLIAAVIGVPMMLLRGPTPASGAAGPPPPRVTLPSSTGSTSHVVVPVKVLDARIPSNPFAAGNPKAAAGPATKLPASGTSSSTATTTSTTSSPAATVTPSSAASSAVTPTVASGTPSSTSTTSTTSSATTTTTVASSPITSATTPTTDAAPAAPTAWTIYAVDVRFGQRADAPVRSDLARLTLLPSAPLPAVMFMGVMTGGRQAVFALGAGVTHRGPGLCRPDHTLCSAIVLSAGQSEQLTVPTAAGALPEILRVVRVRSTVTHSRSAALVAYHRHSAAGQCDLQLADPVLYNSTQGTLSAAADCRQQRWAIAFPHPLSGS